MPHIIPPLRTMTKMFMQGAWLSICQIAVFFGSSALTGNALVTGRALGARRVLLDCATSLEMRSGAFLQLAHQIGVQSIQGGMSAGLDEKRSILAGISEPVLRKEDPSKADSDCSVDRIWAEGFAESATPDCANDFDNGVAVPHSCSIERASS